MYKHVDISSTKLLNILDIHITLSCISMSGIPQIMYGIILGVKLKCLVCIIKLSTRSMYARNFRQNPQNCTEKYP